MNLTKNIRIADLFTIGNMVCGVISLSFSVKALKVALDGLENVRAYSDLEYSYFMAAAVFMIFSFLFDHLDGRIARLRKEENSFGKQLDSLSDIVAFGVAPAVFAMAIGLHDGLSLIILAFFVVCGMLRLARYNVTELTYYQGIPITMNGLLVPILFFIGAFGFLNKVVLVYYLAMGFLMIAQFRLPSFGKKK